MGKGTFIRCASPRALAGSAQLRGSDERRERRRGRDERDKNADRPRVDDRDCEGQRRDEEPAAHPHRWTPESSARQYDHHRRGRQVHVISQAAAAPPTPHSAANNEPVPPKTTDAPTAVREPHPRQTERHQCNSQDPADGPDRFRAELGRQPLRDRIELGAEEDPDDRISGRDEQDENRHDHGHREPQRVVEQPLSLPRSSRRERAARGAVK